MQLADVAGIVGIDVGINQLVALSDGSFVKTSSQEQISESAEDC
jgi:hypothetical protein